MTEKDKKSQGGGLAEEGEFIDVVEMGVEEVRWLETFPIEYSFPGEELSTTGESE